MHTASVSELKANLSHYLREVRRGSEVQILERGVPIARLAGLRPMGNAPDRQHRERLVRAGVLRPGSADMTRVLEAPPMQLPADVRGALDQERTDRL